MRDAGYRTREEVEEWLTRDPIKRFRDHLLRADVADVNTLEAVEREIQTLVDDALEWAKASPYPDPATVLDHVYA
jgi:2-oxoisovalerate dehydrogenase E1 component